MNNFQSKLSLIFLLQHWISMVAGFPQYSSNYDQYSSNYDYEDEEYSLSEDLEDLNSKKINPEDYNPRMNTKGTTVEVSAGTTIRLNCDIENLHADLYQYVMWKRENSANTIISTGNTILTEEYSKRAKVSFSDHGSELTIGAAGAEDGGDYLCSLMLPSNKQSVTHKVVIKGVVSVENNNQAELTLSEGDDMTLECNTLTPDGVPHTNVKWSKQGGLLPNGEIEEETSTLKVLNVKLQDGGVYICTASDDQQKINIHKSVQVNVQETSTDTNSAKRFLISHLSVLLVTLLVSCCLNM